MGSNVQPFLDLRFTLLFLRSCSKIQLLSFRMQLPSSRIQLWVSTLQVSKYNWQGSEHEYMFPSRAPGFRIQPPSFRRQPWPLHWNGHDVVVVESCGPRPLSVWCSLRDWGSLRAPLLQKWSWQFQSSKRDSFTPATRAQGHPLVPRTCRRRFPARIWVITRCGSWGPRPNSRRWRRSKKAIRLAMVGRGNLCR